MSITWHRVWTIVLKNALAEKRNFIRITDALYWPVLDIMIWGFTSTWMSRSADMPHLVLVILTGLVLWQVVMRANYEISIPLIEELWNKSFVSMFTTPLTINEWIIGAMLTGAIKTVGVVFFAITVVWFLYALNIFLVGWMLIPFVLSLMLFGWATGFIGASMIVYWGQKVQNIPWIMAFLFAPVSAVYYSVDVLPWWAQKIAYSLPLVYIFEGMRMVVFHHTIPLKNLAISFALGFMYLGLTILLFKHMFEKSRNRGLDRL